MCKLHVLRLQLREFSHTGKSIMRGVNFNAVKESTAMAVNAVFWLPTSFCTGTHKDLTQQPLRYHFGTTLNTGV